MGFFKERYIPIYDDKVRVKSGFFTGQEGVVKERITKDTGYTDGVSITYKILGSKKEYFIVGGHDLEKMEG